MFKAFTMKIKKINFFILFKFEFKIKFKDQINYSNKLMFGSFKISDSLTIIDLALYTSNPSYTAIP